MSAKAEVALPGYSTPSKFPSEVVAVLVTLISPERVLQVLEP